MIDAKAFGAELAAIVKAATAPLIARIDALEKAAVIQPEPGRDGKDADPDVVASMVFDRVKAELDGQGDEQEVITVEDIKALIISEVASAVSDLPPAQKGEDGTDGKDGDPGPKGDPGRDGLDVKDLFRADGGRLVAVMSDGTTKDLGEYVGKDGVPGADGKDGADGRDGFGFDDLTFEQTGERSAVLRFAKGEHVKEFAITLPGFVDRGVWKDAEEYQPGDGVTYGGSFWIAQAGADGRPDAGKGWRLAVKKGRDGKDGRDGEKGLQGPEGKPGRDLTQLGGDGRKW